MSYFLSFILRLVFLGSHQHHQVWFGTLVPHCEPLSAVEALSFPSLLLDLGRRQSHESLQQRPRFRTCYGSRAGRCQARPSRRAPSAAARRGAPPPLPTTFGKRPIVLLQLASSSSL
ncbi:unnamed protein product [Linum trigynum]|uniref:Secreted protein n=1 Tax=Linum trigynum TaxID=586398 RepID=A0AAV2E654_9ROSI